MCFSLCLEDVFLHCLYVQKANITMPTTRTVPRTAGPTTVKSNPGDAGSTDVKVSVVLTIVGW